MSTHYLVHQTLSKRGHRPGPSPDTDAAKRGGQAVRDKYGREFYVRIGTKGGTTARRRHGREHYARIGRMGGEQTKARYGAEHYARIGRMRKQPRTPSQEQSRR